MSAKNKPNEIRIIRIYDAPVKLVWDAWTDPKKAALWWGPRGFTITTHSKELKPGGMWHYTMHGPDGTDYINKTIYHEVEKYSRLVYDHGGNDEQAPLFRVTVDFSESNGKTKMDMRMALATAEAAAETKKFIKKANGNSTWDRLAEYLEKQASGKEQFVINRTFEAPLQTLFKMWTDAEHFSRWLAPTGFNMSYIRADIKPGGSNFYKMTDGKNITMFGNINYIEIIPNKKIVYTQNFCDEKENLSRHPMAPVWPALMRTEVLFAEESENETRITVRWEIQGEATPAEIEAFIKERGGMTIGWNGSFDKLEEIL